MRFFALTLIFMLHAAFAAAGEFRHVGDYLLKTHFKLISGEMVTIPMKPIAFKVTTDGVTIRISPEGEEEAHTSFDIYRSDGIGQQRPGSGALEVIPGVQASSTKDGTLRHLRLSRESLTITTFPGVSDQTIVSYAVAATPKDQEPVAKP
jgi:hypothetical protein